MSPGRIALGYTVIAILWIAFSDAVVTHLKLDPAVMTIKGAMFVFVTASLLFFTIRRLVQTVRLTSQERDETAKLYRTVVEASNEGICLLDHSGRISFLNGRLAAMLGRPAEELPGKRLQDFLEEPHALAQGGAHQPETHECRLRTDSGRKPWVLISRHPVLNDVGEVAQLVGTVIDITERKRAEQEARDTAAQWQATFDAVQDVVLLLDKDGRIVRANHAAAEFLRLPCDNIVGGHCYGLIHGTSTPPAECPLAKMRQSGRHEEAEVLARKGGPWLSVSADPVFDPSGALTHVVHVARDITERKRAEESLRQSEAYLAEAQRLSRTGSWAFDVASNEYVYVSDEFSRIFGIPQDTSWTVEATLQRIHPGDRERVKRNLEKVVREKVDALDEYRIVLPDGTLKHIHVTRHPLLNSAGDVITIVGSVMDITERKQAEEERRAHVWFLEGMDRINRAMQGSNDLEQVMSDVLEAVLSIFACDRASLVYPCDPQAPTWRVAMEHTGPEFPGAFVLGIHLPVDPEVARVFETARSAGGAVRFGPGAEQPVPAGLAERFKIQAMIAMVIPPKLGNPYLFGLHQCSGSRVWTPTEERLFQEVGHRLTDTLTSLLVFRSLRDSERRLEEAQRIAHVGYWDRDLDAGRITLSDEGARIFGLQPEERVTELPVWHDRWQAIIHPEDRPRAAAAAAAALAGGPRYDVEYRVVHRTGEVRFVHSQGDVIRDESGRPCRMFGIMQDITERKRAEEALRRSEAYLAEGQRLSHVGSWAWNPLAEQCSFWSEEMFRIFEIDPQQGLPTREVFWARIHSEDREGMRELLAKSALEKTDYVHDHRILLPDGAVKHIHAIGHPVLNEAGDLVEFIGTAIDVTERKRAEEERRESAERFRAIADYTYDWESWIGIDEKLLWVNPAVERITGFSVGECMVMPDYPIPIVAEADRETVARQIAEAVRGSSKNDFSFRVRHKDGSLVWVAASWQPIYDSRGARLGHRTSIRDIAERKRAEDAVRRSQAYLAEAERLSHAGSWALDVASGKYLYASEEFFRIFGLDVQEGLPSREDFSRLIHPKDWDRANESFEKQLRERADITIEYRIVLPDGTVKHVQAIRHPVLNDAGEVVQLVGTVMDITDRKRAEEALRESETRFRTFVDHAADAFFMLDFEQGTIVDVNRCACESLGYTREELVGASPTFFHLESDRAQMESVTERAAEGGTVFYTHRHRRKDGSLFPVEVQTSLFWHGGRRYLLKVARDISDRLRAEEQRNRVRQLETDLAHINRVSMMGELAASIAHEIGQPLSGVVSNGGACLRWLTRELPNLEEAKEAARRIVRDGKRAGEVIARVRALTKRTTAPAERLDLNDTLRDVLALLGEEAKQNRVSIHTEFADALAPVSGDRVQLQQVALNLALNAIEAMSSVSDRARELVIITRNLDPDQVQVTVEDAGTGLDPSTIDKIFDAFYTTKSGGMGMGLSISRSIVQAHGGRLWAEAKDGPGTLFHFTLPKSREQESHA